MTVRAAIGIPMHERVDHVTEAIASLLAQTYRDVSFVLVDDGSRDGTAEAAAAAIAGDPRAALHVNPKRVGMVSNWRRAFELARAGGPDLQYFAWASDHDRWHPRWLEELVAALDANPAAVLAYPRDERVDADGVVFRGAQDDFSTVGVRSPARRAASAAARMRAGSMVYGLFRVDALERAGVFRPVLHPDRLLLLELAVEGEFVQVPQTLWRRRYAGASGTRRRQRRSLFASRPPASTYFPSWVVHTLLVLREHGARRHGHERREGIAAAAALAVRLPLHELGMRIVKPLRRAGRIGTRRVRSAVARLLR